MKEFLKYKLLNPEEISKTPEKELINQKELIYQKGIIHDEVFLMLASLLQTSIKSHL